MQRRSRLRRPSATPRPTPRARASRLFPILTVLAVLVAAWLLVVAVVLQNVAAPPATPTHAWWTSLRAPSLPQISRGAALPPVVLQQDGWPVPSDELVDMRRLTAELPFDNPDGGAWKQGWNVEPRAVSADQPLKVLLVPHSHCDPGWIKTFDEYFQQQTSSIITTVVEALLEDERRTFIWAEISYFSWWWDEQDDGRRTQVKQLLDRKQLEFVTGGWVQPDEANSELYAMEIQLQEGHDWIRENLGEAYIPKYGWSIDPFGYSPTMAWLLKKYGFRGMLIQRVHYAVKKELAKRRHLEFYWRQVWDEAGADGGRQEYDMFTHLMPFYSYDAPHTCGPDPAVCCQFDFARTPVGHVGGCPWKKPPQEITADNVKERALLALDQYRKKAALYRSNVVLIPLGDDFRYQTREEADAQYRNHQRIHDYINKNVEGVEIKFGTLSEYFESAIGSFAPPVLKGSFFTYSDVDEDYWSGYFTSRVFDKALDRTLERVLFAAESMGASRLEMREARRALSLFQHHDGVTGTAKNHVVEDYAKRMHDAIRSTQEWLLKHMQQSYPQELATVADAQPCWMSDAPRGLTRNLCGDHGAVLVYNPLETVQHCGLVEVPSKRLKVADLPCETPGPIPASKTKFVFDPKTGLMLEPVREEWKVWKVKKGGAYLFFPGKLQSYFGGKFHIEDGGYVVRSGKWKRTIVERQVPVPTGGPATVIDFIYEVELNVDNEEWFVRFHKDIGNDGFFHTDLNGFDFDTHYFRKDMPIQSQVFPMPTLASIQDEKMRMTIISEHAQGTASLENGSIDVWLDRRLRQDDNRGLGQGVQDNRPTRTRLRVLLESSGYKPTDEFRTTPLAQRMWDELQHPLELFGSHTVALEDAKEHRRRKLNETEEQGSSGLGNMLWDALDMVMDFGSRLFGARRHTVHNTVVPFVYMVYKRVDYLKKAIDSLRRSDFPKTRVPLIISHDGHVPEVVEYVESLKSEFQVIQLVHPHSCYDHPYSFPGNATELNVGYEGDTFGNPRAPWATCAKHHFTWMIKTVFDGLNLRFGKRRAGRQATDTFLFLEEDYLVAPTIYEAVVEGLNLMEMHEKDGFEFFGLGMDPTEGGGKLQPTYISNNAWFASVFRSGPMTISRKIFERFRDEAAAYCRFDEYNWDWSVVHMQSQGLLPHTILMPSRQLSKHIGLTGGMHNKRGNESKVGSERLETRFVGTRLHNEQLGVGRLMHNDGFGGWGHPRDQEHCLEVLEGDA